MARRWFLPKRSSTMASERREASFESLVLSIENVCRFNRGPRHSRNAARPALFPALRLITIPTWPALAIEPARSFKTCYPELLCNVAL